MRSYRLVIACFVSTLIGVAVGRITRACEVCRPNVPVAIMGRGVCLDNGTAMQPFPMESCPVTPGSRVRVVEEGVYCGRSGVVQVPQPAPDVPSIKDAQPDAWARVYGRDGEIIVLIEPQGQLGGARVSLPATALVLIP